MDVSTLLDSIPTLSDLELAVLICLVAEQHCLVTTEDELIDDLATELALIVSETYNLSYAVLSHEDQASVEAFGEAILSQELFADDSALGDQRDVSRKSSAIANTSLKASSRTEKDQDLDTRLVANVIIAKDFNHASRDVQVAALELIRNRRIYSRTTVHPVPKVFLLLPLVSASTSSTRLFHHLNDRIFISHYHNPDDGFPNLEDIGTLTRTRTSTSYPDHRSSGYNTPRSKSNISLQSSRLQISQSVILELHALGTAATITIPVRRYMQDVIVFLRMDRAVDGGVTPLATTMFESLAKFLAPLHRIDFVTPDLVGLAARKIYPHRINIATPDRERSVQYGSSVEAVAEMLQGLTPEDVIENVLATVPCPV